LLFSELKTQKLTTKNSSKTIPTSLRFPTDARVVLPIHPQRAAAGPSCQRRSVKFSTAEGQGRSLSCRFRARDLSDAARGKRYPHSPVFLADNQHPLVLVSESQKMVVAAGRHMGSRPTITSGGGKRKWSPHWLPAAPHFTVKGTNPPNILRPLSAWARVIHGDALPIGQRAALAFAAGLGSRCFCPSALNPAPP